MTLKRLELGTPLLSQDEIGHRVVELGREISADYDGRSLKVIGVLKGAVVFLVDLVRQLALPVTIDFIAVSSYGASSESSGVVRIIKDLDEDIAGCHVLVVEDIVDTGLTLKYLLANFQARQPATLKTCSLLDKPHRRRVEVQVDYTGFVIPDRFVVGYGLDYAGKYRNLPYIAELLSARQG